MEVCTYNGSAKDVLSASTFATLCVGVIVFIGFNASLVLYVINYAASWKPP